VTLPRFTRSDTTSHSRSINARRSRRESQQGEGKSGVITAKDAERTQAAGKTPSLDDLAAKGIL
jgi:hypothetical protein